MNLTTLGTLLIGFILSSVAWAQNHALLIGNNDYKHSPKLSNPVNDVTLLDKRLTAGGFETTLIKDADLRTMTKGLARFCEKAKGADKVFVFYAGHGIEVEGKNYLVPVSAKLESKGDQKWEALSLDKVLDELAAAQMKIKIIVLDCCRDDPFGATRAWRKTRSSNKGGMAEVSADQLSTGSMIVFSGKPGNTVPDGEAGGNSPFTTALNKELVRAKGKSIMGVFSDMGDFLPSTNKHWVKFDSDGETLALLHRTKLFKPSGAVASTTAQPNQPEVKPHHEPIPTATVVSHKQTVIPAGFVHHLKEKHISFYTGKLEGDDAYFALSWSQSDRFSGYCLLHEGSTLYYIEGSQPRKGIMNLNVWHRGKKVRFARLTRDPDTESISWSGKTNLGKIHFSRERRERKSSKYKSTYKGKIGTQPVTVQLQWTSNVDVEGTMVTSTGKKYTLKGDNSINGTIYTNFYDETGHRSLVILKKSIKGGVSWSGLIHFNNGPSTLMRMSK